MDIDHTRLSCLSCPSMLKFFTFIREVRNVSINNISDQLDSSPPLHRLNDCHFAARSRAELFLAATKWPKGFLRR